VSAKSPVAERARDLISNSCLRNWMSGADSEEDRRDGATTDERAELVELRRKLRVAELSRTTFYARRRLLRPENVLPLPSSGH